MTLSRRLMVLAIAAQAGLAAVLFAAPASAASSRPISLDDFTNKIAEDEDAAETIYEALSSEDTVGEGYGCDSDELEEDSESRRRDAQRQGQHQSCIGKVKSAITQPSGVSGVGEAPQ